MSELNLEQRSKILKQKVSTLFKTIQAIHTDAMAAERDINNFPAFRGKYKTLESNYTEFTNSWDSLLEIYILMDKEKDFPVEEKFRTLASSYLFECHTVYETIMNPVPAPQPRESLNSAILLENPSQTQNVTSASLSRSRLPKIIIPTFHGETLKWPQFRDVFVSLVHEEQGLSPIEKFHYLIGALSGEALRVISSFPLTAINYEAAWNALNLRFDNKRVLAGAYMQCIRQFKPQQSSTLSNLRSFLKTIGESFSALKALDIKDEADFLKLYLALECLDPETRRLYEEKQHGQEFPTYASLIEFIEQRCQILELSTSSSVTLPNTTKSTEAAGRHSKVLATIENGPNNSSSSNNFKQPDRYTCPKCKGNHLLFRCYAFNRLSPTERNEFARKSHICFNCLRPGHSVPKCPSKFSCSFCDRKHHSTLHNSFSKGASSTSKSEPTNAVTPAQSTSASVPPSSTPSTGLLGAVTECKTVLLGTALVQMRDWKGTLHPVRIVIDSGSQFSIITTDCAKRLGLTWLPIKHTISGVGCTQPSSVKGTVLCQLLPTNGTANEVHTRALVMSAITTNLPSVSLDPALCQHFLSFNLADDRFWESRPIDFLLGSDLFLQILLPDSTYKVSDNFGTLHTIFGHVVIGVPPEITSHNHGTCLATVDSPVSDDLLKEFWLIEEALPSEYSHPDDVSCEKHFKNTVARLPTGRYMVALPFRNFDQHYPASKHLAMRRFRNLETKLDRDISLKQKYDDFMKEYIELGHMEVTSAISSYVIPHHPVFKREIGLNQEPKLRVVFDASMQTSGGSLNDNLYIGPKLQQDITSVVLNFRTHRIAFCTDIVKMFRQILIRPADRCHQHILWRFSQEEAVQTYELKTVTYGLASSPYLAIRVLLQLAEDDGDRFPDAANILKRDVYVDDVITGANSVDEALILKDQIVSLLGGGGFSVHKWASNSREFLDSISEDTRANVGLLPKDTTTKVLGMLWDSKEDCFYFQVELTPTVITKRTMLSVIARLFDPLGLLAPIVFLAKSILQQLWLLKLDWDHQPPSNIIRTWKEFLTDLPNVKNIKLPRWIPFIKGTPTIFGFCDASHGGYAAVIYVQIVEPDNTTSTFLVKSKTRLAPLKTISIPRLELSAAHLLTKLVRSVENFRKVHCISNVLLFSDSTIVLSWLKMNPSELKTFVANRVGYILSYTEISQWYHVPSKENPADIATKGALPTSLLSLDLWWNGPFWIRTQPLKLPPLPAAIDVPERKHSPTISLSTSPSESPYITILDRTSNYRKAIISVAHLLRFANNMLAIKRKNLKQKFDEISVEELEEANARLVKETQRHYFEKDFDFDSGKCLSLRFKSLAVSLDSVGLLRVGGRLEHADLPYDQRHPILLPPQARLTELLIDYIHRKNFHLGLSALQAYMQRRYHIFKLRSLLRKRIWKCQRCFRDRAKPSSPFMADLPISRVSQGRVFIKVGVDFAGPYSIKLSPRRNSPVSKAYLCIFVCMAVKAVHLEVVSALNTEAFLAAFDRFIARRGLPSDVYSDCGLNFVGAARHLKELYSWYLKSATEHAINNYTAELGIKWHFNPPFAPHFGGLWEAAVKSAKAHLRKTLGDRPFLFEELATIFTRIEAVMNSRPLCPVSAQPRNYDYLTPGHFIIGSALLAPPERDVSSLQLNKQSRWQLLQSAVQIFWKRWANEYIHLLQSRPKWTKQVPPLKLDDLVLLQDLQLPPLKWKIGRVVELHPGKDGIPRVAMVKTSSGYFKRAIHRLAPLPPNDSPQF